MIPVVLIRCQVQAFDRETNIWMRLWQKCPTSHPPSLAEELQSFLFFNVDNCLASFFLFFFFLATEAIFLSQEDSCTKELGRDWDQGRALPSLEAVSRQPQHRCQGSRADKQQEIYGAGDQETVIGAAAAEDKIASMDLYLTLTSTSSLPSRGSGFLLKQF